MKKYWIAEWITWRWIWKLNKKWNERLDKESLSDNDIMQLFEIMWRYIANKCETPEWHFTVIKTKWGKETIWFKIIDKQPTDTKQPEQE